jgi:hypothetical protein
MSRKYDEELRKSRKIHATHYRDSHGAHDIVNDRDSELLQPAIATKHISGKL